jgi:FkbM family methyltransferase
LISNCVPELSNSLPRDEVRLVRGEKLVGGLNRLLPLGRKYHPLVQFLNGKHGLLAIRFDKYRVLQPAAWPKSVTTLLLSNTAGLPEFDLLRPICRQLTGGCIVDAGANQGMYTLLFRSISELPIIAYEPQPFVFKLLEWNIAYNQLTDIDARNLACGAGKGEASFWVGVNGSVVSEAALAKHKPKDLAAAGGDWEREALVAQAGGGIAKVPVAALDEDLAAVPKIALMKIDCEGFEYKILQGAREMIQRHRPVLFVEVHPEQLEQFGDSVQAVLDFLLPKYDLEFWYFRLGRAASKFARSIEKFRRPKARRCPDVPSMLAAAKSVPGPAQLYFLCRPRT